MTLDLQPGDPGDHGVINRVSRQLGIGSKSLRNWVKCTEIDTGARGALTQANQEERPQRRKRPGGTAHETRRNTRGQQGKEALDHTLRSTGGARTEAGQSQRHRIESRLALGR
jgi:transposase-like protein